MHAGFKVEHIRINEGDDKDLMEGEHESASRQLCVMFILHKHIAKPWLQALVSTAQFGPLNSPSVHYHACKLASFRACFDI